MRYVSAILKTPGDPYAVYNKKEVVEKYLEEEGLVKFIDDNYYTNYCLAYATRDKDRDITVFVLERGGTVIQLNVLERGSSEFIDGLVKRLELIRGEHQTIEL